MGVVSFVWYDNPMGLIYNMGIAPVLVGKYVLDAKKHTNIPDVDVKLVLQQNSCLVGEADARFVPPIMRYNDTE